MLIRHLQAMAVDLPEDYELRRLLVGYTKYLLGPKPRSYQALAEFLEFYGREYVLPQIESLLQGTRWKQIVELGPGTGWLIASLGAYVDWGGSRYAFDRRTSLFQPHAGVKFIEKNLESNGEFMVLTNHGPDDTLVVANQFLHCVDNWQWIIYWNRASWLVAEVNSGAWMRQMRAFGASPLTPKQITDAFKSNGYVERGRRQTQTINVTLWSPR